MHWLVSYSISTPTNRFLFMTPDTDAGALGLLRTVDLERPNQSDSYLFISPLLAPRKVLTRVFLSC